MYFSNETDNWIMNEKILEYFEVLKDSVLLSQNLAITGQTKRDLQIHFCI